ncbi:Coiled-coil domain-containing protein 130 [Colletotrichum chlorophyti]|uniref:Coiled-coil domain-containing protein 130 n=1 Tax=Colletotrichum chlorophyti TaxID=708187 RepID=A0A1Q8RL89_9PEZI|nr:Coiled-coil domain-containing protein 130 [Colletotrichum chlorophyti]
MQGFNMGRYIPPDLEGTTTPNKLHKRLPPGSRASKPGVLTVRFELPYAVWCASCPKPTIIGQGVRFNAEKRRTGNYHTTPIWTFRFRHADCGGAIEIRTDPRSTSYVVVSGATKRDTGDDEPREGDLVILTEEERHKLRSNAFASLEKTIEDREALKQATERIDELQDASRRRWDDPYARNGSLRRTFRKGREERERDAAAGEALKSKMGLGIELVPATEEDARRARLVDFGEGVDGVGKVLGKPLFASAGKEKETPVKKGLPKSGVLASRRKGNIVSEIVGNTRMAQDPFLNETRGERTPVRIPGVKRKRGTVSAEEEDEEPKSAKAASGSAPSKTLVGYDSDSD